MKEFMDDWNDHSIRRNTIRNTIGGIPVDLYEMPERHGETMISLFNIPSKFNVFMHA